MMQFDIKVITISITNFGALTEGSAAGLPTTELKGTGVTILQDWIRKTSTICHSSAYPV